MKWALFCIQWLRTKARHFILDTEVENGKCQPCIRLLTFYLLSAEKRLSSRYSNFQLWKCCSGECQVRFRIAIQIWCNVNQLQDLWESRCLAGELLQILPALKMACLAPLRVLALDMCGKQRYLVTLSIFGSKGLGIFKLLLLGLLCVHAYTSLLPKCNH